ncbi:MAG TPA: hypothetical protein VMT18_00120, partial [Planctomycetota bacterium]|nr:hypothetical protein [Planctomycetota bacterium]
MDALHPLDLSALAAAGRGALVLAAASLLLGLLHRRLSASARHAGWLMALVALAVVSWVPQRGVPWRIELPRLSTSEVEPAPEAPRPQRTAHTLPDVSPTTTREVEAEPIALPVAGTLATRAAVSEVAREPARPRPLPWLAWAWLVGTALAFVRPLVGLVRARRWIADARPVPPALHAEWLELADDPACRTRLLECERAD